MCYGMGCQYESSRGNCRKPSRVPCPQDEADVEAWEKAENGRLDALEDEAPEDE